MRVGDSIMESDGGIAVNYTGFWAQTQVELRVSFCLIVCTVPCKSWKFRFCSIYGIPRALPGDLL